MKKLSLLVLSAFIAGCAAQPVYDPYAKIRHLKPPPDAQNRELTEPEKNALKEAFQTVLKDPESARYEWPKYVENPNAQVYCGFVNAKNSYGGYTGFKLFYASLLTNDQGEQVAIIHDAGKHSTTFCPFFGYSW